MENKCMKQVLVLLATGTTQIKTTRRQSHTPLRICRMKNSVDARCWLGHREAVFCSYAAGGSIKRCSWKKRTTGKSAAVSQTKQKSSKTEHAATPQLSSYTLGPLSRRNETLKSTQESARGFSYQLYLCISLLPPL